MKITLLRAAAQNLDFGLSGLIRTVSAVLTELGLEIEETDLNAPGPENDIPFFQGMIPDAGPLAGIIASVRRSPGVIFAVSAPFRAVCAPALRFLEYLSLPECAEAFEGKNCMLLAASPKNGGEAEALEYLSRALAGAGAYDSVRVGLREGGGPEIDAGIKDIIEKQAEDFYRLVRQNRKFIAPKPWGPPPADARLNFSVPKAKKSLSEIYEKLGIDGNDAARNEDINEITKFFTEKRDSAADEARGGKAGRAQAPGLAERTAPSRGDGACRKMTRDLPGRFKPLAAQGLSAAVALSVSGAETFEGWLDIKDAECAFRDGAPPSGPDMTILADAAVWSDALKGKISVQKAFMTGRLKVRGNFALLPKLDQMFEWPVNGDGNGNDGGL